MSKHVIIHVINFLILEAQNDFPKIVIIRLILEPQNDFPKIVIVVPKIVIVVPNSQNCYS